MNPEIRKLLQELSDFKETAEGVGLELRLSLSEIVIRRLRQLNWTQRKLAEHAGFKESFVSRVLHSDDNCTLDTVGRLLHAVGVRARLHEYVASVARTADETLTILSTWSEESRGKASIKSATTVQCYRYAAASAGGASARQGTPAMAG